MDIKELANKAVTHSEKEGASQAEAYIISTRTSSVYIDDDIPKIADVKTETGLGLMLIIGKKIGFTSSTLSSESIEDVVLRAKSVANVSNEDPKFVSLPDPKKVSGKPDRFFDKDTAQADTQLLLKSTMEVVDSAHNDIITVPNGVLRASSAKFHVCNSLGVDSGSSSTIVFGFFTAKAEESGAVGEGVQRCWSRSIADIDFKQIGEKIKSQALGVLKANVFKDRWDDVIGVITPSEASELICSLVGYSASAEYVNRKSSPWAEKLGEKVTHSSVNIYDNGLSDRGLLSSIVDDEGVPTQKTSIVEKGVLKSFISDTYNARQLDQESTGNAMRRDPREVQGGFSSRASCGLTTLEIPASSRSVEDIISEVERGIFIEHFAWPQVDTSTGAFSNEIRNGVLIENGELTSQIKYALWVGNLFDALKKPIMVASDAEIHGSSLPPPYSCVLPTIAFQGTEIVGQ